MLGRLDGLVFENAFVLQGNRPEELPEQVLGCARVYRVDFSRKRPFLEIAQDASKARMSVDDHGLASSPGGCEPVARAAVESQCSGQRPTEQVHDAGRNTGGEVAAGDVRNDTGR